MFLITAINLRESIIVAFITRDGNGCQSLKNFFKERRYETKVSTLVNRKSVKGGNGRLYTTAESPYKFLKA